LTFPVGSEAVYYRGNGHGCGYEDNYHDDFELADSWCRER
jgi:hypothetical protein